MPKVDNYIKFLNAFYAWEQQNDLTYIQECILMRILRRVNASGWCEWVKISNTELINELKISCNNTFINNRNRLIQLGLIQYLGGKKGKPSSYKLNMPQRKEIIYSFGKEKESDGNKKNSMPDILNKKEYSMLNIPKTILNSIPNNILNNPCNPHEQCAKNTPKHKTINNKHKEIYKENPEKKLSPKSNDVLLLYNEVCSELSKVTKLSAKRKKAVDKMFCLGYTLEQMKKVFKMANSSDFLCGKLEKSTFRANFDWLMKEDNFLKVLEGTYQTFENKSTQLSNIKPSYDIDEYENHSIFDEIENTETG